ncbi:MAG: zinc ribbon domain-containing protein [Haloarculaceae archaeon]
MLVYDKRCATFNDDHATLSTVEGRITAEYVLPDESRETPHSEYLFDDDYEVTGAELHYRGGEFYLHVRTKADVEFETADEGNDGHSTVLGVDLGMENVAVTSTGSFWNGSALNHWHREFEKRRGSLQQVSPAYTSQRCSNCGFTHENNRSTSDGQDVFECVKYLRSAQTSSGGGAPVNVCLNRGTLNVNGDYEPAADGGQNGSPRESHRKTASFEASAEFHSAGGPTLNEANGEAVSE